MRRALWVQAGRRSGRMAGLCSAFCLRGIAAGERAATTGVCFIRLLCAARAGGRATARRAVLTCRRQLMVVLQGGSAGPAEPRDAAARAGHGRCRAAAARACLSSAERGLWHLQPRNGKCVHVDSREERAPILLRGREGAATDGAAVWWCLSERRGAAARAMIGCRVCVPLSLLPAPENAVPGDGDRQGAINPAPRKTARGKHFELPWHAMRGPSRQHDAQRRRDSSLALRAEMK
jgi:hypothetical protein